MLLLQIRHHGHFFGKRFTFSGDVRIGSDGARFDVQASACGINPKLSITVSPQALKEVRLGRSLWRTA